MQRLLDVRPLRGQQQKDAHEKKPGQLTLYLVQCSIVRLVFVEADVVKIACRTHGNQPTSCVQLSFVSSPSLPPAGDACFTRVCRLIFCARLHALLGSTPCLFVCLFFSPGHCVDARNVPGRDGGGGREGSAPDGERARVCIVLEGDCGVESARVHVPLLQPLLCAHGGRKDDRPKSGGKVRMCFRDALCVGVLHPSGG